MKDHALQELDKLFKDELSQSRDNIKIYQNMNAIVSCFSDIGGDWSKTSTKVEEMRKDLNRLSFDYVNFYEKEKNNLLKEHNEYVRILRSIPLNNHKTKDFSYLPSHKPTHPSIYEIPVELIPYPPTEHV